MFGFHHDHAQIDLPGVANPHTEFVEVHLGVEVVEETVLHEEFLILTERGGALPGPVVLLDTVETLDKGADVLCLFISPAPRVWLEGSQISK